jgi:ferredoxin
MWHIACIDDRRPEAPRKGVPVTHVVTDACIKCKYTDCVDVCPVDCFKQGPHFLVIDPDECIDCAVCIPECPVNAIYADTDTPEQFKPFLEINARLSQLWPTISKRIAPLPDAELWKDKTDKLAGLDLG